MTGTGPFQLHHERYEAWFNRHEAVFFSADEVEQLLRRAGFIMEGWGQTLSQPLAETQTIEPLRPGHGQSAFVVAAARTPT